MKNCLLKTQKTGAVDMPDDFEDGYDAEGYYVAKVDGIVITFVSYEEYLEYTEAA